MKIKQGMMLTLTDGRRIKIMEFLGEGAQGSVWKCSVPEKPRDPNCVHQTMALKWYKKCPSLEFIENLEKNVAEGAPDPRLVWPVAVTRRQMGSMGYVMPLIPSDYHELSKFRNAKVRFQSFAAILHAMLETCEIFSKIHLRGLAFNDINDGGLFVNEFSGKVLVADCDNVFPQGAPSPVIGKARYMAPEVVMGQCRPNIYTDRFSMAVILWMYAFLDHPCEGEQVVKYPCLTEAVENRLFGSDICFVYDDNDRNLPVRGVHNNVLTFWPLWPENFRNLFKGEFTHKKMVEDPQSRMTEGEWIAKLKQVRDNLVLCPHCGDETFVARCDGNIIDRITGSSDRCLNPRCRKPIKADYYLNQGKARHIPLIAGSLLYFDQLDAPSAQVVINMRDNALLLRNLEPCQWIITTLSGKRLPASRGEYIPVKPGLTIETKSGTWNIGS